jgi:hypothetical protein
MPSRTLSNPNRADPNNRSKRTRKKLYQTSELNSTKNQTIINIIIKDLF